MSARLIYRNATPEALAWAADYKDRSTAVHTARFEWMTALYDQHGVPADPDGDKHIRGAFVRGCAFSGISWPEDVAMPGGWFRPVKTPQLIRPRGNTKAGKAAEKEMRRFDRPDARRELAKRFGMPDVLFVGNGLFTNGVRIEDDGVWVTWATKDAEDELADPKVMRHYPAFATAGWTKVPLVEYIQRFGEDEALR